MSVEQAGTPVHDRGPGFEERDVKFRNVIGAAVGGTIVTLIFVALMWWLYWHLADREAALSPPASPLASEYGRKEPPAPRLQTDPRKDLQALHDHERELLTTYAWVDRDEGVIRIPVERAIALLAERGLPGNANDGAAAGAAATPSAHGGAPGVPIQKRTRERARMHVAPPSGGGGR